MYIKDVAIDRYGAWSHLRLTDLDPRLTVIYGANGSGKSTLVRFLQAMLYGFPHFQESPAPAQSSPWGGSLTVEGPHGGCLIRRHDNGTRTGRLSLHTADGAPLDRDVLANILGGVEEATFRLLFVPGFRDPPSTAALVEMALARGFDLTATTSPSAIAVEDRLAWWDDERGEIARLQERRRQVEAEIEALNLMLAARREEERRRIQAEIDRCTAEHLHVSRELQAIDDELAAGKLPSGELTGGSAETQSLRRRLAAVQTQRQRWGQIRQDILKRRARLRREVMSWAAVDAGSPVPLGPTTQSRLEMVERRLEQLRPEVHETARSEPLLNALREEVYLACRETHRHYLDERRDAILEEVKHLRRCHREVRMQLGRLARRKAALERALQTQPAVTAPLRGRRVEVADRLRRLERQRTDLLEERRRLDVAIHFEDGAGRLERARLEALQRDLDERLERLAARDWPESPAPRFRRDETPSLHATVLEEASEHLRRLSGGELTRLHVRAAEGAILLEDIRGECRALDLQDRSVRDRVHLAMCLAMVEAYARRGVRLPLILDDPLLHLSPSQAEQAGVLLREFSARGHQVLVFTCREAEARMLRRLGAPVLELPVESSLHEQRAWRWSSEPAPLEAIAEAVDPGSLLARRVERRREPREVRSPGRHARRYLDRNDAIHYAPDLPKATADSLAALGVGTVGDFLALAPHAVAERLARLNVPGETIRRWQATARLMCDTPNLRAYDARMLAYSGISSAEELDRLTSEEVLGRVKRCLESEEGRRLFALGDDEELTRLASWIGAGRATQTLREAQRRNGTRRRTHAA